MSGIGPQPGASQVVGGSTLPSNPTVRQIFCVPGTGIFVCLVAGTWTLLSAGSSGTVSGSGVTTRLTRWIDGTGSVLGDSGVADDGTNVLSLRPFAVGYGLSTPAALLAGPRISAASTISTSPRGILSAQFSSDTAGARVGFQKARGTLGTPTTVVTGDTLGRLMFRGYDGTSYLEMGSIEVAATGTIGTNRVPTQLVFSTATDAATSVLTTALTIGADQRAVFTGSVGIQTTVTPLAPLHVGTYTTNNSVGAQILVSQQLTNGNGSGNGHAFSDSSLVSRTNGGPIGYNSYDARMVFGGTANYDHYAAFQVSPSLNHTGTMTNFYGLLDNTSLGGSGNVTNYAAVWVKDPTSAGGAITNRYGLYVESLTLATNNYGVYTAGTTPSHFGGLIDTGSGVRLNDGVVGTPAMAFTSETNTGFYRAASNDVRLSIGGADKLQVTATGTTVRGGDLTNGTGGFNSSSYLIAEASSRINWSGRARMLSPADGQVEFTNNAQSGFNAFSMGVAPPSVIGTAPTHAQTLSILQGEELLTIAASPTSTTTMQIPAGAIVLSVSVRVTTVIPTATTFTVTGTSSATTFSTAAVSTAATTTNVGTAAGAYYNGTAQTITITPNLTPSDNTGRVRVTISYIVISPATS